VNNQGRQLGLLVLLAVPGAAQAAIASGLTWWSADYLDPLTGPVTVTASGATCAPALIPLALVGLAGLGAALATRGLPRRLVGAVVLACGTAVAVLSAMSLTGPPAALAGSLTRPADPVGAAQLHPVGPGLGVAGGVLLTAAGLLIAMGVGARRALGSRYEPPTGRSAGLAAAAPTGKTIEPTDPGDWWKVLDAGGDPTTTELPADSAPAVSEQTSEGGYHDPNASRPS